MRSITRSRYPHRRLLEASLPLQIKATNWQPADGIDVCIGDLVMTIIEVIVGNMISAGNHQILLKKIIGTKPKAIYETAGKRWFPPLLVFGRCTGEEEREGP
jgi:hypothetical protein